MKESTIEQKAKAYDKAVERLRNAFYDNNSRMCEEYRNAVLKIIEPIFPELAESEDERIRKWLIKEMGRRLSCWTSTEVTKEQVLAWLEKQGEKPNNVCDKELSEILGRVIRRYINDPNIPYTEREKVSMEIIPYVERLEKQGEQKPVEDKIWSIYDAKDGDVLSWDNGRYTIIFKELKDNKIIAHCSYNNHSEHFGTQGNYDTTFDSDLKFIPATKEQCDLLFQKMKDAGYEWDFEKKELKKIEQKSVVDTKVVIPKFRVGDIVKSKSQPMLSPRKIISIGKDCYWCEDRGCIGFAWEDDCELVEQNTSWSEEDVAMLDSAIAFVEHSPFSTIGKGKNNVIAWLKNLKDKVLTQIK